MTQYGLILHEDQARRGHLETISSQNLGIIGNYDETQKKAIELGRKLIADNQANWQVETIEDSFLGRWVIDFCCGGYIGREFTIVMYRKTI